MELDVSGEETQLLVNDTTNIDLNCKSEVLASLLVKILPPPWKVKLALFIALSPLFVQQILDETASLVVTGCSYTRGNFSIETCCESGAIKILDPGMKFVPKTTGIDIGLYIAGILVICAMSFAIEDMVKIQRRSMKLLPYRVYLNIPKSRFIVEICWIFACIITYVILKFVKSTPGIQEIYDYVKTRPIYLIVEQPASVWSQVVQFLVYAAVFRGPIMNLYQRVTNFYSDLDLKTILQNAPPSALTELAEVRMLDLEDFEKAVRQYVMKRSDKLNYVTLLMMKEDALDRAMEQIMRQDLPFKKLPL